MAKQKLTFGQKLKRDTKKVGDNWTRRIDNSNKRIADGKKARQAKRDTKEYKQDPLKGTLYNNRMRRKASSQKARVKYGIATRKRGDAPRQDGATAKGKDGVTRRYDAATKTWKIVR